MATLKSLTVNRYRGVAPKTALTFAPGVNLLLGKNGTGKSTLLELICMVLSSNFALLAREEYDLEFVLGTKQGDVRARVSNERRLVPVAELEQKAVDSIASFQFSAKIVVETSDYGQCSISSDPDGVRVSAPHLDLPAVGSPPFGPSTLLPLVIWRGAKSLGEHPLRDALRDAAAEIMHFELNRADESLDLFNEFVAEASIRTNGKHGFIAYRGEWLTPHVEAQLKEKKQSLALDGTEIPEFRRLVALLGFKSAEIRLDLLESSKDDEGNELRRYGNIGIRFTKQDDTVIIHSLLSYGQKRLLALFWYLSANPRFAIVDELPNGLHYEWIEGALEELGERQCFLTSQNPLLLDALPVESEQEALRRFILCRTGMQDGREFMVWRSPTEEEAGDFWRAQQVGVMQVAEILRDKGLW